MHTEKSPEQVGICSQLAEYRILKSDDLITIPQFVVMSAADAFHSPIQRVHELL